VARPRGGGLRADLTPLRLLTQARRAWALAHLTLGPEPAGVAALRALAHLTLGCLGAAVFGQPFPQAPILESPLLDAPAASVLVRLGRALGAAAAAPLLPTARTTGEGRPAPLRDHAWPEVPRGLWTRGAPPRAFTPLKLPTTGPHEWHCSTFEGPTQAYRVEHLYRSYTKVRGAMTAKARQVPSWGPGISHPPTEIRTPRQTKPEFPEVLGAFGPGARAHSAPEDQAGAPLLTLRGRDLDEVPVMWPDLSFTHYPYQGLIAQRPLIPRLTVSDGPLVMVPRYVLPYDVPQTCDYAEAIVARFTTRPPTFVVGDVYEKVGPDCDYWRPDVWKVRPFFAELAPWRPAKITWGAGQLDPLGEVGGAPYHYDGVPIRVLPVSGGRGAQALYASQAPDRAFYAIRPFYTDLAHKLRVCYFVELGQRAEVRGGPMLERGGAFRYARPPVRPAPAHLWWGRLHGRLRGPGPWRWEWPDYFAPNRYIGGLYVSGSRQRQHRARDADETPLYQRQQWTPPTRVRAYVHQARPEAQRRWWQFGHYPELRRPWVQSTRLRTPPSCYKGRLPPGPAQWVTPHPEAAANLDPAWHQGTWPANTAGIDLFYCRLDLIGIAARRLHPVRANGAFAYLRYLYYSDLMYAPARATPPRPRSVGVLGPLARGPVPCLRPKALMHADGLIEVHPSRGGPLVADLPMFQRGGELAQPPLVAHAYDLAVALWPRVVRVWEVAQGPHAEAPHYLLREVGRSLVLAAKALAKSAG
jgi:hypothetical protein